MKHSTNNNQIDRTIALWQPRFALEQSLEDGRQISENATSFFAIPGEWSRVGMPTPANDASKAVASDNHEVRDER